MDIGKVNIPLAQSAHLDADQQNIDDLFISFQEVRKQISISAGVSILTASAAIVSGRAVSIVANKLVHADKDIPHPAVGLAVQSVAANARCRYVLLQGYISGLTGLVAGTTYYLGAAGVLLNAKPGAGIIQGIGYALSATELLLNVSQP